MPEMPLENCVHCHASFGATHAPDCPTMSKPIPQMEALSEESALNIWAPEGEDALSERTRERFDMFNAIEAMDWNTINEAREQLRDTDKTMLIALNRCVAARIGKIDTEQETNEAIERAITELKTLILDEKVRDRRLVARAFGSLGNAAIPVIEELIAANVEEEWQGDSEYGGKLVQAFLRRSLEKIRAAENKDAVTPQETDRYIANALSEDEKKEYIRNLITHRDPSAYSPSFQKDAESNPFPKIEAALETTQKEFPSLLGIFPVGSLAKGYWQPQNEIKKKASDCDIIIVYRDVEEVKSRDERKDEQQKIIIALYRAVHDLDPELELETKGIIDSSDDSVEFDSPFKPTRFLGAEADLEHTKRRYLQDQEQEFQKHLERRGRMSQKYHIGISRMYNNAYNEECKRIRMASFRRKGFDGDSYDIDKQGEEEQKKLDEAFEKKYIAREKYRDEFMRRGYGAREKSLMGWEHGWMATGDFEYSKASRFGLSKQDIDYVECSRGFLWLQPELESLQHEYGVDIVRENG